MAALALAAAPTPMVPFGGGDLIPRALRREKRWAPWVTKWLPMARGGVGKWDKRPGLGKSTARPDTWMTFEDALAELDKHPGKYAGIGYVTTGQTVVVGIDLDHCVDAGVIAPWAQEVVDQLASYTEISPSGTGLRVMVLGSTPNDWNNHEVGIEVYGGNSSRFLTITGNHVEGTPLDLCAPPAGALEALEKRHARERTKADVVDLAMPDVIDDLLLPTIENLEIPHKIKDFLLEGTFTGPDRSLTLFTTAIALYVAGLPDEEVFSILVHNEFSMAYALEKRHQDYDRALLYIWRHFCCKGRAKASESLVSADDFDVLTVDVAVAALPNFRRDGNGAIKAERENVVQALVRSELTGFEIRRDTFRDEVMIAPRGAEEWRAFKDSDYMEICIRMERGAVGFKSIPKELIRDAVGYVAEQMQFDSAQHWLTSLRWDGIHRVGSSLMNYFGAEDTPYTRAVALYFWTALAGRVIDPGIKADMVPVAVGAQGVGKSTTVAAIVPSPDFFLELDLGTKDDDQARLMRGKLVVELGELKGLRKRERESVKAFISRTHESWVPKFKEMTTQYARRCIFFGTTNKDEFLLDETGHRRWLPFIAGQCRPAGMAADREQLWAEARELYQTNGVMWREAERLAVDEHGKYVEQDAWDGVVSSWLNTEIELIGGRPIDGWVTSTQVLVDALHFDPKAITAALKDRAGALLTSMGLKPGRPYIDGKRVRAYARGG